MTDAVIIGRFPPPLDGQTIATERLSSLLSRRISVARIDTQPLQTGPRNQSGVTMSRLLHFIRLRSRLRRQLRGTADSAIIWSSASPDAAGHFRDVLFVLPELRRFDEVIAVVHRGNFDKVFRSVITRHTAARLVASVSKFVFLTRDLSNTCSPWIPSRKRYVIPNAIDSDVLFSAEEIASKQLDGRAKGSFEVLFLSNMIRSKGYAEVVEAVGILTKRGVRTTVRLAGAWPSRSEKAHFDQVVERLGLADAVEHEGPVYERSRVKELYRNADALALPSYYPNEAQPLAIIEALNAGLPVVATRHGGIPEMIVDDVEGFLVPKRDPAAVADAVSKMLDRNRWVRLSEGARKRFEREFASSAILQQWLKLLDHREHEIAS